MIIRIVDYNRLKICLWCENDKLLRNDPNTKSMSETANLISLLFIPSCKGTMFVWLFLAHLVCNAAEPRQNTYTCGLVFHAKREIASTVCTYYMHRWGNSHFLSRHDTHQGSLPIATGHYTICFHFPQEKSPSRPHAIFIFSLCALAADDAALLFSTPLSL